MLPLSPVKLSAERIAGLGAAPLRSGGFDRTFGDRAFQIQFYTTNLRMISTVSAASFPTLNPSTAIGRRVFREDVILLGAYISGTFITVAAGETCCVGIARAQTTPLRAIGDANTFLQMTVDHSANGPAGAELWRNVGTMFAPPFLPLIQQKTGLQLFGTDQTLAEWSVLATIYYCRLEDYQRLMNA